MGDFRVLIYLDQFLLNHRPFAIQPDSAFLYWSKQHETTFAAMRREILAGSTFTLLTGEIGAGKTLLINELLSDPEIDKKYNIALVKSAHCEGSVMLDQLCQAFARTDALGDPWKTVVSGVQELRANGISPLVIIDEAQTLSDEGAAVLGQLTTGNRGQFNPVPVILVGQPELRGIVNNAAFRSLKRSLGLQMHLKPLSAEEVGHYINKRMETAGAPANSGTFEPDTFPMIYRATKGVPRMINKLCELSLFLAAKKGVKTVSAGFLRDVLVNHVDPETLSFTGGGMTAEQPIQIDMDRPVVLQPPAAKQKKTSVVSPAAELPALEPTPETATRSETVPRRKRKRSRRYGVLTLLIGGGAAAGVAFVLIQSGNQGFVFPKTALVSQDVPNSVTTAVTQSMTQPSESEPIEVSTATLARVYDAAKDPAQPYFDRAIAAFDKTEIKIAYARAAIRGHKRGALYLGQLFETGDGVPFAPDIATRWYAVSDAKSALASPLIEPDTTLPAKQVTLLFSTAENGNGEFIWQGQGSIFHLELGDADGTPIAQYSTPLTAALVGLPAGAVQWRIRTDKTAKWSPIMPE